MAESRAVWAAATRATATGSLVVMLSACSGMLPKAQNATSGGWQTFEEAKLSIESIKPYETRLADLHELGIDPYRNPTITILTYSDLLQRFSAGGVLRPDEMDRGLVDCLRAGKACFGYAIVQRRVDKNRVGNFFLDSFNFLRDTEVTGWTFNALIIIVDDKVVYTLHGGQPQLREREITRNPLGPLQNWGDSAGRVLLN